MERELWIEFIPHDLSSITLPALLANKPFCNIIAFYFPKTPFSVVIPQASKDCLKDFPTLTEYFWPLTLTGQNTW